MCVEVSQPLEIASEWVLGSKSQGAWRLVHFVFEQEQGAVTDPQLARTFAILEPNFNGRGERASVSA